MKYPHTKGSVSLYFSLEQNVYPKLSMTQRQEKTLLKEKDHVRELQKQLKNDSTTTEAIQCTNSLRAISNYDIPPLRPRTVHCLSTFILYCNF